ncbi:MAG: leucyl aminopeptidase [Leptospiraceae bacterium]|nr:leucyl aminopeptidase [Leptospiraceae bacterium]MCK6381784.1 leucyl aminopeptidase [Leptospiraceae bacterium]NUM41646.1 leucyl aminopeptidase [Leptospiraceae bacterium]
MKIDESKLKFSVSRSSKKSSCLKIHHVFKDKISSDLKRKFDLQIGGNMFTGEWNQQLESSTENTIYLGLGDEDSLNIRKISEVYIKLGAKISKWKGVDLEIHLSKGLILSLTPFHELIYHLSVALEVGAYDLKVLSKEFKSNKRETCNITFIVEDENKIPDAKKSLEKAKIVSKYLNEARYIQHLPANYFTPVEFVERSREIAKTTNLNITVFDEDRLKREKFGGILAVSKGSPIKPKMILLEYMPKKKSRSVQLAIIGKGLTFDAGGISIKPSADMHEMKYDMSGAAVAIHAIAAIASLKLDISVIAAIGVVENMPDGEAIRPGDVYTAYNGTTVEVQNTDAEGRLVLGDVLAYVSKKYKPTYMVDLATLTGAVITALGHEAAALISNSGLFIDYIQKASNVSKDRVWEMPFWEEYGEDLKSDIADLKNITGGKGAGTLSAAQFLFKFIDPKIEWAHLDIAGTAWRGKPSGTQSSGPTGYGVRLLVELAEVLRNK